MTEILVPLLLAVLLALTMLSGPRLMRASSPLFMRMPRVAVATLISALLLWFAAFAALSLMLAWSVTGPKLLPAPLDRVCGRCLAAASPFDSPIELSSSLPVVVFLLIPFFALVVGVVVASVSLVRRARGDSSLARAVATRAVATQIAGHRVMLLPDARPIACSLPLRRGGIVVSEGLCAVLNHQELVAVLEHENAHVRQRHHFVVAALEAVARPLRWIPMVAAIRDAVPHYLEIAADDHARRSTSTPALASALLKIGGSRPNLGVPSRSGSDASVLHAAGPNRIRQLVAPAAVRSALLPVVTTGAMLFTFAAVGAAVHVPYLYVVLTGCQLPA